MLQVLVVDDEVLARSRLRSLLGECRAPGACVTAEAGNAAQAMALLRHHRFDLMLLDVHMPGADGLALARALRELPAPPPIVFVTAHSEHAVQAFELEAADYLTKPVRLERLQQALAKASRQAQAATDTAPPAPADALVIHERGRVVRLPLAEIVYFKAELKYVTVRTASRSYILDTPLTELEERYPDLFLRVHRNALAACHALRALERHHDAPDGEGWAVRMEGVAEVLAVSRRQLGAVREVLAR